MGREYRRQPFRTALGVLLSLFSVSVDSFIFFYFIRQLASSSLNSPWC